LARHDRGPARRARRRRPGRPTHTAAGHSSGSHRAASDRPLRAAPGHAAGGGPPPGALAGFWRRLAGAFLDWLLVGIVASAIGALFGLDTFSSPADQGDRLRIQANLTGPFILVELVYFTYFHATSAGQSIGNKIMGIRVLDAGNGRPLPYVRAFARSLMSNVSALPCFLGFFWALWDRRQQTWHDMVADSVVVKASVYPPGEFGRPAR
jgi:uncharacterized RDD family membrane protein YckC